MTDQELIKELRDFADACPPECVVQDEVDVMGERVTRYCMPYWEWQRLIETAAKRLEELTGGEQ